MSLPPAASPVPASRLPLVHPLPDQLDLAATFARLAVHNGCLWLDSAATGPDRWLPEATDHNGADPLPQPEPVGRYSFLTADPIRTLRAYPGDADPWPTLRRWAAALPQQAVAGLPPFQGGLAGLWGYEAAAWLESVPLAQHDDLPTPAVQVGLYDWVIAQDHTGGHTWLICQGFRDETGQRDPQLAQQRCDQVLQWLAAAPTPASSLTASLAASPAPATSLKKHPTPIDGVTSNFSSADYRHAIDQIVDRICHGDSFQVNLSQRLLVPATEPSDQLYLRLRQHNPAPLAGYYDGGEFQVLSSSPEGFLRLRDGHVQTRPIKGTVPRSGDPRRDQQAAATLSASAKDRAENVMIVDLMRSDLSRVCLDDSIQVASLCQVEPYAFVQHLVSVVNGRLRPGVAAIDVLAACFPGGSITGAPKIEAMRTIAQWEPTRRGPYCGSLGYVSSGGAAEFNILIRTVTATAGQWQLPVGGGITARSSASDEEQETWDKAAGMLTAIRGGIMRS